MGKLLVRLTLIGVTIYFILAFFFAQYIGIDILLDFHVIPFELVVVVYCYSEGKYHCQYIKHLSIAILFSDSLSRLDNHLGLLSVTAHNLIPLTILALGMAISLILAFRHFYKVLKLKRTRK